MVLRAEVATHLGHKKLLGVVVGIAVSLAAVALQVRRQQCNQALVLAAPPVAFAVSALGYLEPAGHVIKLSGPASLEPLRIARLLVTEGDFVEAGRTVAVLDSHATRMEAVHEARARVAVAEAQLAQLRAGAKPSDIHAVEALADRAASEAANARKEYERHLELFKYGVVAANSLESKKLLLDETEAELRRASAALDSACEVREVDLDVAQAALGSARASLQRAEADANLSLIKSPVAGSVLKIHALPGEVIGDKGVLELGNTEQMCAVAEVYETDASRVRVGEGATVTLRATGERFSGIVNQVGVLVARKGIVGDDPAADVDARVVEVRINFDAASSSHLAALTNARVEVVFLP